MAKKKKPFDVLITRTTYASHTFRVEAETAQEAESLAMGNASNFDGWNTGDGEYEVALTKLKRSIKK